MALSTALPILLLGLILGVALGYAWAIARSRTSLASGTDVVAQCRAETAQWRARAEELAQRATIAEERSDRDMSILRALAPVRAQVEQVTTRVEAMERERAGQHAALSEQLRAHAQAERDLLRTTSSLAAALRSRSSRGLWGEVELARVLELSGMLPHVDFSEQRSVGSILTRHRSSAPHMRTGHDDGAVARPDVVVHLPGEGYLAIDAKVPMDSYLNACERQEVVDGDDSEVRHLMRAHSAALRSHVDQLAARRYDRALGSAPELVVLFIPAQPILAAALNADPTLMEYALSKSVALVCPSSLLSLLRVCATAWARTAVNDDARELLTLGRTLYERLGTVASHLDALGTALSRSVRAYNRTVASVESRLLVTARSFDSLASDLPDTPAAIAPDEAQLRSMSAPELTHSARQHTE